MLRTIQYARHAEGYYVSRVGSELAWPVLEFEAIGCGGRDCDINTGLPSEHEYPVGSFKGPMRYHLTKIHVFDAAGKDWRLLKWMRTDVPVPVKNYHRAFWGMKALRSLPEKS